MSEEKHPLLVRAGIDDVLLEMDFEEFMVGVVKAPDLTFQYSEQGELCNSSLFTTTPLCEDAPAIYRERFIKRWTVGGRINGLPDLKGEVCWERLRELVGSLLQQLPDNEFVLEEAWLAGLVSEMPPRFRSMLEKLHARIAEHRAGQGQEAEVTTRARESGQRQVLRTWMTDRCRNGNSDQCSFDNATEYVLPDGSHKTEYRCCY